MTAPKPSCVVLGGGGFLGINLCRGLLNAGHRVRAFGRRCLFPEALQGVEWYEGNFADTAALSAAIATFDVVFHLVHTTTPQTANLDLAGDIKGNVLPSLALFEICRALKVTRVVFVSSGGAIYGVADQIPTPETAPTNPITAYGVSKLAIEKYLALYEYLHGMDYRVLRVANAFGPFELPTRNRGIVGTLLTQADGDRRFVIWGDGSAVRDLVFVEDVVDALIAVVADDSDQRIFNIGSGHGRSVREIIAAVERLLGIELKKEWKPGRLGDVSVSVVAIDRAREILGWEPRTDFESGLRKTIEWWRAHHLSL